MLTAEEMLKQATELTYMDVYDSKPWENLVRAENTYVGNMYTSSAYFVQEVETEYAVVENASGYSNAKFKLYLSRDELGLLNKGEKIQFVGIVDSIEKESDLVVVFTMREAHYVTNRMTLFGEFSTTEYDGNKYGVIGTTASLLDTDALKNLKEGDNVKVEGVIRYDHDIAFYFQMTSHIAYIMTDIAVME